MVEVTAEWYCKSDEKLLKVISYQNSKYFHDIISHTTEYSSTSAADTDGN